MIAYPQINPIAFSVGPLQVHWYGLMYLVGFLGAYGLGYYRNKRYHLGFTNEQLSDLIFYGAIGVVLGGRIGYMLFYNFQELLVSPLSLFKIWQGGMSFHGGLIGVILAMYLFAWRNQCPFWAVIDFVAPLVPLGLGAGRLGNFINGELWGRPTDVPWAMVFPHVDELPRHPSQLYEFGLEGIVLFALLWVYAAKPRAAGQVSGVFLIGYALCRMLVECFRTPDPQLGFVAFGWLTMGQLLSIPMLLLGIWLWWAKR